MVPWEKKAETAQKEFTPFTKYSVVKAKQKKLSVY